MSNLMYNNEIVMTRVKAVETLGINDARFKNNFSKNTKYILDGRDYFTLSHSDVIEHNLRVSLRYPGQVIDYKGNQGLKLWTRKGVARMAKIATSPESWDIIDEVIEVYFAVEAETQNPESDLYGRLDDLFKMNDVLKANAERYPQKVINGTLYDGMAFQDGDEYDQSVRFASVARMKARYGASNIPSPYSLNKVGAYLNQVPIDIYNVNGAISKGYSAQVFAEFDLSIPTQLH